MLKKEYRQAKTSYTA